MRKNKLGYYFAQEFLNLKKNFKNDSRVIIENEDSYQKLSKLLPPKEKRAVILIDPSYEV